MSVEVFSWPEGELLLYPSGGATAAIAYAFDSNLEKTWDIQTVTLMGGTGATFTRYVTKSVSVKADIGQLFHTMTMWSMAQSGTGLTFEMRHSSVAGNSAGFVGYGARFPSWKVTESDGQVAKSNVTLIMPDVSAYGNGI